MFFLYFVFYWLRKKTLSSFADEITVEVILGIRVVNTIELLQQHLRTTEIWITCRMARLELLWLLLLTSPPREVLPSPPEYTGFSMVVSPRSLLPPMPNLDMSCIWLQRPFLNNITQWDEHGAETTVSKIHLQKESDLFHYVPPTAQRGDIVEHC